MQKQYVIQFYNRFSCQTQTFTVNANNKIEAIRKFKERYPENIYYDCIDFIEEA